MAIRITGLLSIFLASIKFTLHIAETTLISLLL